MDDLLLNKVLQWTVDSGSVVAPAVLLGWLIVREVRRAVADVHNAISKCEPKVTVHLTAERPLPVELVRLDPTPHPTPTVEAK